MSNEKKIRKLSLSYLKETLSRKSRGTTENAFSDSAGSGPAHFGLHSSLQTAALDLARPPQVNHDNNFEGGRHKLMSRSCSQHPENSTPGTWGRSTRDKSPGLFKTLRKHFTLKSQSENKFSGGRHKSSSSVHNFFKLSNSSHELCRGERALCPLPASHQGGPDPAAPPEDPGGSSSASNSGSSYCRDDQPFEVISHLEDDLYTEAQSVFVDLARSAAGAGGGYDETCDLTDNDLLNNPSNPKSTSLTCQLLKLSKSGWYWGPISREEAEEKLTDQPDGAFLVRDSSADRYLLSLSFRSNGKTLHTRIEHSFGLFSFYSHPEQDGFGSIVELIDNSMHFSQSGVFCYSRPRSPGYPSFPVRLTKPISRFTQVRSLQYLCRFVIRQNTRVDNIGKLPLPPSIKGYLEEGHY